MASRIARKSAAPKLNRFQITAEALGVEEALFDTLHGLGWQYADIAAVARGAELVTSYGMPAA
jgi:hypothetical protein